jgi:hypothetical protein
MAAADPNIPTDILAETQNYIIWSADEPDGELTYNVELGSVTLHFFKEEWDEFLSLIQAVPSDGAAKPKGQGKPN